jgi:hypothetical protein
MNSPLEIKSEVPPIKRFSQLPVFQETKTAELQAQMPNTSFGEPQGYNQQMITEN